MAGYEILLLDDGSETLQELSWILGRDGFQVSLPSSNVVPHLPDSAIANFDLIAARVILPFTTLKGLIGKFKKLNPCGATILFSEDYDYTFPLEAFQLEIDDYIIMPGTVAEVWRRVKNCLHQVKLNYLRALSDKSISELNVKALTRLKSSLLVKFLSSLMEKKVYQTSDREPIRGFYHNPVYLT